MCVVLRKAQFHRSTPGTVFPGGRGGGLRQNWAGLAELGRAGGCVGGVGVAGIIKAEGVG